MVQMRGSRNFHQGGGEGQGQSDKKALTTIFFSPQLILQKTNSEFQRNLSFFKARDGVQFFPGGPTFSRGCPIANCLFPIETHLICDFPEGVRTPCPPPLWIRTWCSPHSFMVKATIHYLIWAWQTLIDRRMYNPFIVIYLVISVYYRNLRCFNG